MPAPSPEFGSEPAAPRWSRLCRAVSPAATIFREARPCTSATKATPQASLSLAGSYRPDAAGTAENGTAVPPEAEGAAGAVDSDMSLPSSAGRPRPVVGDGSGAGGAGARRGG